MTSPAEIELDELELKHEKLQAQNKALAYERDLALEGRETPQLKKLRAENEKLKRALVLITKKAPQCEEYGQCEDNPCIYRLACVALRGK